jgi:glycosyltransferase involved in cell wall biosynthesis
MIDIIIPTYNRKALLEMTLKSLVNQSTPREFMNVVVVDDGSSDGTEAVVKYYKDKLNLRYFYQEDRGYRVGRGRNLGLKNSYSDICLLIDSGILLASDCVNSHLDFHNKFDSPIACIGYVFGFDNEDSNLDDLDEIVETKQSVDSIIEYLHQKRMFLDVRESEYASFNHLIHLLPAPWVYFWSGHVSFNRQCMQGEEYFDLAFEPRYGYEDIDLGYRLHARGIKICLNTSAKTFHFPHRKKNSYASDLIINSNVFYDKHKAEIIKLFNDNGGVFGFNDLLIKMGYGSHSNLTCRTLPHQIA